MDMVRVRGRAPGPRQNQSENDGREISQGGPPCEISQAVPDASRAVPVLADLKFRASDCPLACLEGLSPSGSMSCPAAAISVT